MKIRSTFMRLGYLLFVAGALAASPSAKAAGILVDQINPYANKIGPGGGDWDAAFTNILAAQPGGYSLGSIANASDVANASAILVVYRNPFDGPNTLSASEIANLTAFLETGRRVVLVGEGDFFSTWNNSLVSFANDTVGGSAVSVGSQYSGSTATSVANALTNGVNPFNLQGAGVVVGGGGTALFDRNFATLWGANLLTVLDAQVFRNLAPAGSGDATFRNNVAAWLGEPLAVSETPLPAAFPLMLGGLAVLGFAASRRKTRTGAV